MTACILSLSICGDRDGLFSGMSLLGDSVFSTRFVSVYREG